MPQKSRSKQPQKKSVSDIVVYLSPFFTVVVSFLSLGYSFVTGNDLKAAQTKITQLEVKITNLTSCISGLNNSSGGGGGVNGGGGGGGGGGPCGPGGGGGSGSLIIQQAPQKSN